jgi:hypothetical protein
MGRDDTNVNDLCLPKLSAPAFIKKIKTDYIDKALHATAFGAGRGEIAS